MSTVLGISGGYHAAAAALVRDGEIVAAISQERISRIKNDPAFPRQAIDAVLRMGGPRPGEALDPRELDAVVFYEEPFDKLERVMVELVRNLPRSWRQFPRALASQLGSKIWMLDRIAEELGVERRRVSSVAHHEAHAASTFFPSGYEHAAVLIVDGVGEHASTSLWEGRGRELRCLETIDFPHSLGLLYAGITSWLGFAVNEGEYKVMGLAAWGDAERGDLRAQFDRLLRVEPDGSYTLDLAAFAHLSDAELGFGPELERRLGPRRPPGLAWDLRSERDRHYADVAAALQAALERALLALARRAFERTGAPKLCLAGGVALNCVANARLAREAPFQAIFVQPAAGDAGGALGAALLGARAHGDAPSRQMHHAALGAPIDAARARAVGEALGWTPRRLDEPDAEVARRIAAGEIVAHIRGRAEWGPRALGQRSLLAAPQTRATRDRLNRIIKQREDFRPFAPAVLASHYATYFDGTPDDMTPFMTSAVGVRAPAELAAVTHEDGTSRAQSVDEYNPGLMGVLEAVEREGLPPIVLNTSLNGPGEPIVDGAEDALAFAMRHPVDAMILEDLCWERPR